jgi:hypothetical protein
VRGWDQALITSMLEEQDDELGELARELRPRVHGERRQIAGFFGSELGRYEALAMLAAVLGGMPDAKGGIADRMEVMPDPELRWGHLRDTLAEPGVGVILLEVIQSQLASREQTDDLLDSLAGVKGGRLVISHVSGAGAAQEDVADLEARLRKAGVVVATSNAAAARLAGMVMG